MLDNFNLNIMKRAKQENNSIMDALINFCEENNIEEYEDVVELLDPILLDKLKEEFYRKKFFPAKRTTNSMFDLFD